MVDQKPSKGGRFEQRGTKEGRSYVSEHLVVIYGGRASYLACTTAPLGTSACKIKPVTWASDERRNLLEWCKTEAGETTVGVRKKKKRRKPGFYNPANS